MGCNQVHVHAVLGLARSLGNSMMLACQVSVLGSLLIVSRYRYREAPRQHGVLELPFCDDFVLFVFSCLSLILLCVCLFYAIIISTEEVGPAEIIRRITAEVWRERDHH